MKRTTKGFCIILLIILAAVLVIPVEAYAGIGDWLEEKAVVNSLGWIISGVFFLLSLFLGTSVLRFKRSAHEFKDICVEIYRSRKPDSEGGTKITGNELDRIMKEAGEFGNAIIETVAFRKSGG